MKNRELIKRLMDLDMESEVVFDFIPAYNPKPEAGIKIPETKKYPVDVITYVYDKAVDKEKDIVLIRTRYRPNEEN